MSSSNNFKNPVSGMDRYGKQRLKLAVLLRDKILPKNLPWIIENGTLLGAWRSGDFIPHDDDFDFALFFEKDAKKQLIKLLDTIRAALPDPYKARLVTTYCSKIEVFDPTYGSYFLKGPEYNGADYYHVSADLQVYEQDGERYYALYNINPQGFVIHAKDVFPIRSIDLEGEVFNAPNNIEGVLKSLYGSLAPTAKYNVNTGRYEGPIKEEVKNK